VRTEGGCCDGLASRLLEAREWQQPTGWEGQQPGAQAPRRPPARPPAPPRQVRRLDDEAEAAALAAAELRRQLSDNAALTAGERRELAGRLAALGAAGRRAPSC
jgi:hypothetical protein